MERCGISHSAAKTAVFEDRGGADAGCGASQRGGAGADVAGRVAGADKNSVPRTQGSGRRWVEGARSGWFSVVFLLSQPLFISTNDHRRTDVTERQIGVSEALSGTLRQMPSLPWL